MARVYNPIQSKPGKINGTGTFIKPTNGQTVLQTFRVPVPRTTPAQLAQPSHYQALRLQWATLSESDKSSWKVCSANYPRQRLDGTWYQLNSNLMFAACGARRIALGLSPLTHWSGLWYQPYLYALLVDVGGQTVEIDWLPSQPYIYHVEIYLQRLQSPSRQPDFRFARLQGRPQSWLPPFILSPVPPGFYAAWGRFLDPRDGTIGELSPPSSFAVQGD